MQGNLTRQRYDTLVHLNFKPGSFDRNLLPGAPMIFDFRSTLRWVWILMLGLPSVGTAQMLRPEALTIDDGLSQGMIYDLLQTRDGFLWIATKDGLNRYDGYNFKVFAHEPADSFSLSDNTVTALFEDSRGLLWIGTESRGLNVLDRRTGRFHRLRLPVRTGEDRFSVEVQQIAEAPDGSLWVAQMGNGVFRIQLPNDWRDRAVLDPVATASAVSPLLHENFNALTVRPDGEVLVSSNKRLYRINRANLSFENIPLPLPPVPFGKPPITSSALLPNGDCWVAGFDYALRLRGDRHDLFQFPNVALFTLVRSDNAGNAWLIVENKLWRIAEGRDPDPARPDLVLDRAASDVLQDHTGNVWAGTRGYGLRKLNLKKSLFRAGAEGLSIAGLWEDSAGRVYAKNHLSTIFRYDPLTGTLGKQTAFPDASNRQSWLAFGPGGDCWLLCGVKGDDTKSWLRRYPADGGPARSWAFEHASFVYAQCRFDPEGFIWVTGQGCQLIRFDPRTGVFTNFNFGHLFPGNAGTVRIVALTFDGRGDLWLGTQTGLVRGVKNAGKIDFQLFTAEPGNPNSLPFNSIACLLPDPADPANALWIGTKGSGMSRFDFNRGQFRHVTEAQGLPNNVVYGILPDEAGNLWCSTNRGIVRLAFDGPSGAFGQPRVAAFTASDGLQNSEFNTQAFGKAPGGALLFGGVSGLNRFFPGELDFNAPAPAVFIVGLAIDHRKVKPGEPGAPFTTQIEYLDRLELAHDQNNVSFEFAALNFNAPAKNRYRYQLAGLENTWVEAGADHFAHYSHLPPGRYVFRVVGSDGNGIWSEHPVEITLVIRPPWWRSIPAFIVYFLLISGAAWRAYRFQINRIRLREQLAFEHRETQRVRALEQMKTDFFANVTHEFRTPLTLMLEPVRQLLQNPRDPLLTDKLKLVDRNSRRLLGLVNQLLDLAKLESGGLSLDLRHDDLNATVHGVFLSFLPSAEQKGVRLTWLAPDRIPRFAFDAGKVELILNNLLANALKFTPEGGSVQLQVVSRKSSVVIQITDTGIGIPAEALPHVFERFYQVEGAHRQPGAAAPTGVWNRGTGIGLALSKELAVLMGGDITAESPVWPGDANGKAGSGSRFTFRLPITTGEMPAEAERPAAPPPREEAERPLVLIIEDHNELRAFIRQSIGSSWQVAEAANGIDGVQAALQMVPDLVISDLMMPGKDGYDVCAELKNHELTAHIPIILLTARDALQSKIKGLRAGADDYLTKPFHADELRARMENLVALRRKLRERYERHGNDRAVSETAKEELLSPPDQAFLRRFTQTLEEHLDDETLGVEDFAGKMYISRVQLHRKLKALTGLSATEFIRDYRLERAMALLKKREGGVAEVAMRVGFVNEKYFSTVFKEKFSVSPSQVE